MVHSTTRPTSLLRRLRTFPYRAATALLNYLGKPLYNFKLNFRIWFHRIKFSTEEVWRITQLLSNLVTIRFFRDSNEHLECPKDYFHTFWLNFSDFDDDLWEYIWAVFWFTATLKMSVCNNFVSLYKNKRTIHYS